MSGLAPRAPGDSVRQRRSSDASRRPLNFTVRLRVSQQAVSTSSWARPLIVVWVLAVVPVCVLCGYTMLYYVDLLNPTRQECLEGAMMGAAWAVPAMLIIGITG